MKKLNIIQYTPYFPPHKWGLETVAYEISKYWTKNNFGRFINITSSFNHDLNNKNIKKIIFKNQPIWYEIHWFEVLIVPSIEIVFNFPMFKFWSKEYKLIQLYLQQKVQKQDYRVMTHTRFFLTSFHWGLFAKKHNLKWYHIEHGSWYAKLSSKFKTNIWIVYDKIIWKWIFNNSYKNLPISSACERFIYSFNSSDEIKKKTSVFYRGLDLWNININKSWEIKLFFVWRLVSLKWVHDLIHAYKKSWVPNELIIVWDGDEKKSLLKQSSGLNIKFLWFQKSKFVIDYLSKHNCILINPSYQEWLPTTVIEWLATWNPVIATQVWWTSEISNLEDLVLIESWNIVLLSEKIIEVIKNYDMLQWKSITLVNNKFNWDNNIINLYNILK